MNSKFISIIKNKFDIIILSQTSRVNDLSLFCIDGYTNYYNNSDFNQNDGVVLYVKNTIKHLVNTITMQNNLKFLRAEILYKM